METTRWKVDENETLPLAVIEDTADGMGVCEIGANGTESAHASPEMWARARLIASAPDLLAALEGMIEWARRVDTLNPGPEVAQARAAIAKAKGEA